MEVYETNRESRSAFGLFYLGRCADVILKECQEYAVKSIFVTAPMEYRIAVTMQKDHLEEKAHASFAKPTL